MNFYNESLKQLLRNLLCTPGILCETNKFHLSFLTNFRIFMSIYLTIVHFNSSISEMSFSLFGTIIGSNVEFLSCRTAISRSP